MDRRLFLQSAVGLSLLPALPAGGDSPSPAPAAAEHPGGFAHLLECPLCWAEKCLTDPQTGEPFRANYAQRILLTQSELRHVNQLHRRTGASTAQAILALHWAVTHPHSQVLCYAPSIQDGDAVWFRLEDFLKCSHPLNGCVRYLGSQRIEIGPGSLSSLIRRISPYQTQSRSDSPSADLTRSGLTGQHADLLLVDNATWVPEYVWPYFKRLYSPSPTQPKGTRVRVYSTPAFSTEITQYARLCLDPKFDKTWSRFHLASWDNPEPLREPGLWLNFHNEFQARFHPDVERHFRRLRLRG